ncbi:MAG: hypothetical protein PHD43_23580 [Methylococcales bacterium]|nr:hypothetical protein [Methylococcales bacterium]
MDKFTLQPGQSRKDRFAAGLIEEMGNPLSEFARQDAWKPPCLAEIQTASVFDSGQRKSLP